MTPDNEHQSQPVLFKIQTPAASGYINCIYRSGLSRRKQRVEFKNYFIAKLPAGADSEYAKTAFDAIQEHKKTQSAPGTTGRSRVHAFRIADDQPSVARERSLTLRSEFEAVQGPFLRYEYTGSIWPLNDPHNGLDDRIQIFESRVSSEIRYMLEKRPEDVAAATIQLQIRRGVIVCTDRPGCSLSKNKRPEYSPASLVYMMPFTLDFKTGHVHVSSCDAAEAVLLEKKTNKTEFADRLFGRLVQYDLLVVNDLADLEPLKKCWSMQSSPPRDGDCVLALEDMWHILLLRNVLSSFVNSADFMPHEERFCKIDCKFDEARNGDSARICVEAMRSILVDKMLLSAILNDMKKCPLITIEHYNLPGSVGYTLFLSFVHECHRRGIYMESDKDRLHRNYSPSKSKRGGLILKAKPGIHEQVHTLDIERTYPNIILDGALCFHDRQTPSPDHSISTHASDASEKQPGLDLSCMGRSNVIRRSKQFPMLRPWEHKSVDAETRARGAQFEEGVLQTIVKRGLAARQDCEDKLAHAARTDPAKAALYKVFVAVSKLTVNKIYGFLYSLKSSYGLYCPELGELITFIGRALELELCRWFRSRGFDIVAGHTDSIHVTQGTSSVSVHDTLRAFNQHLRDELNLKYSRVKYERLSRVMMVENNVSHVDLLSETEIAQREVTKSSLYSPIVKRCYTRCMAETMLEHERCMAEGDTFAVSAEDMARRLVELVDLETLSYTDNKKYRERVAKENEHSRIINMRPASHVQEYLAQFASGIELRCRDTISSSWMRFKRSAPLSAQNSAPQYETQIVPVVETPDGVLYDYCTYLEMSKRGHMGSKPTAMAQCMRLIKQNKTKWAAALAQHASTASNAQTTQHRKRKRRDKTGHAACDVTIRIRSTMAELVEDM